MLGKIALIGSGELSESMAESHRILMAQVGAPPHPVFLDSMAGFELNIDYIDRKAGSYFQRNLGLNLAIARYRTLEDPSAQIAAALIALENANYIFAGPGSPSYGARILRDSRVWTRVLECWRSGAMLVFASAAAITLGKYLLPVYEIYKVGTPLHWLDGLNLLGEIGLEAAVVPHWNNNSGDQHDTRYCFMGAARFAALQKQLPQSAQVIGIDEYTTLLIDPNLRQGHVLGIGNVSMGQGDTYRQFRKDSVVDFEHLEAASAQVQILSAELPNPKQDSTRAPQSDQETEALAAQIETALASYDLHTAAQGLFGLSLIAETGIEQGLSWRTEAAVSALQLLLPRLAAIEASAGHLAAFEQERAALLNLLILAREELRKAKVWAVADALRDGLTQLGYTLNDTPNGTTWSQKDS